jgi:hypothetical protein
MTVRVFVVGSVVTTVMSWAMWAAIVAFLDPLRAGWLGYLLFFLVLFLAVASTSGIVGYVVRRIITPQQLSAYAVRVALRQGVLLGIFFNIVLFLQLIRLYQWWISIIVIVLFLSIELVFLSFDRVSNQRSQTVHE